MFIYLPFLNTYKYYSKFYSHEQEYWLKESNFLYLILWMLWFLFIYFQSFKNLFYLFILFIIVRVISLLFWLDFIPDHIKEKIFNSYKTNVFTVFSWVIWFIKYLIINFYQFLTQKPKAPLSKILDNTKDFCELDYDLKTVLKKPKKYLFLILSYLFLIVYFLYLFYTNINSFNLYIIYFSLLLLIFFFVLKIYLTKKISNIPILTALLFYISKLF